jgi:cytidine deaminase
MATSKQISLSGPELVIGLVAPVGTDLDGLQAALTESLLQVGYEAGAIRLSALLSAVPGLTTRLTCRTEDERYTTHMDAGTELREKMGRGDALALLAVSAIMDKRQQLTGEASKEASRYCYILRSLKHPKEVETLRGIYGSSFILIAAYAPREQRLQNLATRISESRHCFQISDSRVTAEQLLLRDEAEQGKELGQQVRKAFPLADVFIDTSEPDQLRTAVARFVEVLFGYAFHTPTRDEYGMFHAQAAAVRSAALGRQVGAAITTEDGDIVAVGTNEVPKAGGGLYWSGDHPDYRDFVTGSDINDKLKRRLLADVLQRIKDAGWLRKELNEKEIGTLVKEVEGDPGSIIGRAQLMNIIEYGRCVHAEMAAIVDAARRGVALAGRILYATTFPCHECARHIVAAGIRKVVYIEPYPKSLVPEL